MRIHLDTVGGIAGDMFLAAILDAWPDLRECVEAAMRVAGLPPGWRLALAAKRSGGILGRHLSVLPPAGGAAGSGAGRYAAIRDRLASAALAEPVRARAQDMFQRLAAAEAAVHGVAPEDVHFHELAGWDSVADIAGAAAAIEALGAAEWSVSALPLGAGRVGSAHGPLPVPAPATARLLAGWRFVDDGIAGERVTPTGAVILAHLGARQDRRAAGLLARSGIGVGSRTLDGCANILRLLSFESDAETAGAPASDRGWRHGRVGIIGFEVDDQSGEDLAIGLDRLRAHDDVLDAIQMPVAGKKGRLAVHVRLLCRPAGLDRVIRACFLETATIGLRYRIEDRAELLREERETPLGRVKIAIRPSGAATAKPAAADLATAGDHAARAARRTAIAAAAGGGRGPQPEGNGGG